MSSGIKRIQDLRVGDIFLGPIGGAVGLGVSLGELLVDGGFRVGRVDVRHAGIVVGNARLAQAMPTGAEIVDITPDKHWTDRCLYARLPEDYPGQAEDVALVAREMVKAKVAYSFASYPALALHRWTGGWPGLDRWIARRRPGTRDVGGSWTKDFPVEAICSVFVDQAWTLTGKTVIRGVADQAVSPSLLARTLIQTDGVILGWPGLYPAL